MASSQSGSDIEELNSIREDLLQEVRRNFLSRGVFEGTIRTKMWPALRKRLASFSTVEGIDEYAQTRLADDAIGLVKDQIQFVQGWIQWFRSLTKVQQQDLTTACRWYAFHCDSYLNAIYRDLPYPRRKLIMHADSLFFADEHSVWVGSFFQNPALENSWCNDQVVESPFSAFLARRPFRLRQYVQRIKEVTSYLHTTFTYAPLSYPIPQRVTMYRGLLLLKGQTVRMDLSGITSVAIDKSQAEYFSTFPLHRTDCQTEDDPDLTTRDSTTATCSRSRFPKEHGLSLSTFARSRQRASLRLSTKEHCR